MKTLAAIAAAAVLFLGAADQTKAAAFSPASVFTAFGQVATAPATTAASTQIIVTVSISKQRMDLQMIDRYGTTDIAVWKVSTGRTGFETPTGEYKPTWTDIDHTSDTYDNAPMPYAVFFTGGYAVHGTEYVKRLGTAASHGCVRLAPENAEVFYDLVKRYGMTNTHIVIEA